jgi:hypothetical protein
MKVKYLFVFILLYLSCIQVFGQSYKVSNCDASSFPVINITIQDRDPAKWTNQNLLLFENNQPITNFSLKPLPATNEKEKTIFILFENNNGNNSGPQTTDLKNFLLEILNYFSEEDELYFTEFNWTKRNGKVLDESEIYKGNKQAIIKRAESIRQVTGGNKIHESSELNTGIAEALEYLSKTKNNETTDNIILVLSAEFSNIYNSNYNPEAIIYSSRTKNIPIYGIRYPKVAEKYTLEQICNETYGEHFKINLTQNIKAQATEYKKIINKISSRAAGNQYLLSYITNHKAGEGVVNIKIQRANDVNQIETVFAAPSYLQYIFLDRKRFLIALAIVLVILAAVVALFYQLRKRRMMEQEKKERRIKEMQEEAKRELESQKKNLERLENENKIQKEKEFLNRQQHEADLAFQASENRYRALSRYPILISHEGEQYPVGFRTYIGRSSQDGCSICIEDTTISRKHACILFEQKSAESLPEHDSSFYFFDLDSSNGSFVNGQRVTQAVRLNNGDVLQLGLKKLTFRF